MAPVPPSANASRRDAVDPAVDLRDLLLVFPLHPPAPASARARVAASYYPRIRSDELDHVSLPPRGLRAVVTDPLQSGSGVDRDELNALSADESSELSSPEPSSPGLHTPMDSPPVARALRSMGKDSEDIPDIGHLLIHNRSPAPSVAGGSLSRKIYGAIGVQPPDGPPLHYNDDYAQLPHLYKLVIALCNSEDEYRKKPQSAETLGLFVDTGSDDTFGFGARTLEIVLSRGGMDTEHRSSWKNVESDQLHTFIPNGYDASLSNTELLDQGLVLGRMAYADRAVAHLVLMEDKITVLECYDTTAEKMHPIFLRWRFGVTIGANGKLWSDSADGMLGLGASNIQQAYQVYPNCIRKPLNFLAVLRHKLKEIPPSRAGENIALFFCLRFAPQWYPHGLPGGRPVQSWMSFNTWPCDHQPEWNKHKIIVRDTPPQERTWTVYLRSIKFARVESSRRPVAIEDLEPSSYLEDATITFAKSETEWGLEVLLDTGCATTFLPTHAVESMHKNLFMNQDALDMPQDGKLPSTYKIDPNSELLDERWKVQVVYEFGGARSTSVFVTGPLEGFAYQRNPDNSDELEGLIFSNAGPWQAEGTLGLNFFQTMYVSLHKATDGLDFVRMAAQWPEKLSDDLKKYRVDGVSSM